MNKTKINFFVDFLAFVSFLIVALTGLIIFFFLPSGVKGGRYLEFLGITKYTYVQIHNYFGIFMIILVFIHLILHWNWIKSVTLSFFKKNYHGK